MKVKYKMSDEGTTDAVDKIKPFVSIKAKRNKSNGDENIMK